MNTTATAAGSAALIIPTIESALAKVELSTDSLLAMRNAYAPHWQAFEALVASSRDIRPDEPKKAKAARLAFKQVRCAAENTRKQLKEDSLRRGKAIDGIYNVLEFALAPCEAAMLEIEEAEERAEAKRKADLQAARQALLAPYMATDHMALGEMGSEAWESLLAGAKAAKQAKLDAEAKETAEWVEQVRLAKEERERKAEADRLERERMQAENERLAKVAAEERAKREESERAAAKQREEERAAQKAKDDEAARLQAIADKAAREERQRLAAKAEAEKRKAELAQAELDRIERDAADKKKAEAAAVKKAARAPDRAKVAEVAQAIAAIKVPKMATEEGQAVAALIQAQLTKFVEWAQKEGAKL